MNATPGRVTVNDNGQSASITQIDAVLSEIEDGVLELSDKPGSDRWIRATPNSVIDLEDAE